MVIINQKSMPKKPKEYKVYGKEGYIRTYDVKTHGQGAKKLAEQFAKKIKGKVK